MMLSELIHLLSGQFEESGDMPVFIYEHPEHDGWGQPLDIDVLWNARIGWTNCIEIVPAFECKYDFEKDENK